MSTRYLIAAALMVGGACGAQAAVIPTTGHAAQPGVLSNIVPHGGNGATGDSKGGGAADAGGVVDGAPSGNFDNSPHPGNSGNGAVVTTPHVGGQAGGAVVELPIPAQSHGNGGGSGGGSAGGDLGQDLPVTLPTAPAPAAAVPEPSSIALMVAGLLGALGVARRRKH